jgi:hypothetical protein
MSLIIRLHFWQSLQVLDFNLDLRVTGLLLGKGDLFIFVLDAAVRTKIEVHRDSHLLLLLQFLKILF